VTADATFRARVPQPRGTNARSAHVVAAVAGQRSPAVSLDQRVRITSVRGLRANRVRVRARLHGEQVRGRAVVVERRLGCAPTLQDVVGSARTGAHGSVALDVPRPSADQGAAVLRLHTRGRRPVWSLPIVVRSNRP
jgi:hypothetical protein